MNRTKHTAVILSLVGMLALFGPIHGQEEPQFDDPMASTSFMSYDPPSTLVVPETLVSQAKYPFIDVHNHQFQLGADQDIAELIAGMDSINLQVMVNLSGRGFQRTENEDGTFSFDIDSSEYLENAIRRVHEQAPGRVVNFTNISFTNWDAPDWVEKTVADLERDVAAGAQGLKIYKSLGMMNQDAEGNLIPANHPKLDPVWAACGELGIPVLIHVADPAPFWQSKDVHNERLYELIERPGRYRGPDFEPSFEQLVEQQHDVFRRHPDTKFINAHLGWFGNDLGRMARLLDEMPNVYTEIGAVLAELGRQPRFARQFLVDYQDRVMFGKDSWNVEEYYAYFRVLETDDDYIKYYRRRHAFWRLYGLDLPDEVLKKLYYKNALAVIPGIDPTPFPD